MFIIELARARGHIRACECVYSGDSFAYATAHTLTYVIHLLCSYANSESAGAGNGVTRDPNKVPFFFYLFFYYYISHARCFQIAKQNGIIGFQLSCWYYEVHPRLFVHDVAV